MNDKNTVPPYTNRGAQNTEGTPLSACVDWFSCTFKGLKNPQKVIDYLGLDNCEFTFFDSGKYGYPCHWRFGHIAVYFGEQDTVFLDMSGQGCREFEEFGKYNWSLFFGALLTQKINITRLDLAIDDKKGYFTVAKVRKKIKKKVDKEGNSFTEVRSRFHTASIFEQVRLSDGEDLGMTVYFGSPSSMIQIRIYDKYKQILNKKSKDKKIQEEFKKELGDLKHWVRTEMQLRDDRAFLAAKLISENDDSNLSKQIFGHLRNYLLFVDHDPNDINKSRWKVSAWWDKFLSDVEKLPLTMKSPDVSIEKTRDWMEKSVSANFAMLMQAYDYNADLVVDFLVKGLSKQKKKHENMLSAYKGKNYNPIDMIEKRDKLITELLNIKLEDREKEKEQLQNSELS